MKPQFNQTIQTPIGKGVVQSPVIQFGGTSKYLVRLPINEQTTLHLKDVNCITPRASQSGLWVFTEAELSGKPASEEMSNAPTN